VRFPDTRKMDYFLLSVNDQQVLRIQFNPGNGSSTEMILPNGHIMHNVSHDSPDGLFDWTFVSIELGNDNDVLKSVVNFNESKEHLKFNFLPHFHNVNISLCNDESAESYFCNM
jgi:hypothetical protein